MKKPSTNVIVIINVIVIKLSNSNIHLTIRRLVQWLDVVWELADNVTCRTVTADDVVAPGVVAIFDTASELGAALPDDLGEMASGR